MKVIKVSLARLKSQTFNPTKGRTANEDDLKSLMASLAVHGQLQPIVISPDYSVIIGHRRVAAAIALGWDGIYAIVETRNPDEIYGSEGWTAKPLSNANVIQIYLSHPAALPSRMFKSTKGMEEVIGHGLMQKLGKNNLSRATFTQANRVAVYCDTTSHGDIRKILHWLIDHKMTRIVRQAMDHSVPPAKIREAIRTYQPLEHKFVVKRQKRSKAA